MALHSFLFLLFCWNCIGAAREPKLQRIISTEMDCYNNFILFNDGRGYKDINTATLTVINEFSYITIPYALWRVDTIRKTSSHYYFKRYFKGRFPPTASRDRFRCIAHISVEFNPNDEMAISATKTLVTENIYGKIYSGKVYLLMGNHNSETLKEQRDAIIRSQTPNSFNYRYLLFVMSLEANEEDVYFICLGCNKELGYLGKYNRRRPRDWETEIIQLEIPWNFYEVSGKRCGNTDYTNEYFLRAFQNPRFKMEALLVSILLRNFHNLTLNEEKYCGNKWNSRKGYERSLIVMIYDDVPSSWPTENFPSTIIVMNAHKYNFLSCVVLEDEHLSFQAYLQPFQRSAWIAILLAIFAVVVFLEGVSYLEGLPAFTFLFVVYTYILNISYSLPRPLHRIPWIKLTIGPFLLGFIVITNCYSGVVVTDLTEPRAVRTIDTFKDLAETKDILIFTPMKDAYTPYILSLTDKHKDYMMWTYNCNNNLNKTLENMVLNPGGFFDACRNYQAYDRLEFDYSDKKRQHDIIKVCSRIQYCAAGVFLFLSESYMNQLDGEKFFDKISNRTREQAIAVKDKIGYPLEMPGMNIQQWISQCHNSVFMDKQTLLHRFLDDSNWDYDKRIHPKRKLYFGDGKDPINYKYTIFTVRMRSLGLYLMHTVHNVRLHTLSHSGLLEKWREWEKMANYIQCTRCSERTDGPRPLNFNNSNIGTIFIIYSVSFVTVLFVLVGKIVILEWHVLALRFLMAKLICLKYIRRIIDRRVEKMSKRVNLNLQNPTRRQ